jgi:NADH-quinone oxidoreductase subunit K
MTDQALMALPVSHGLIFAAALFCVGLAGVLIRRNVIFMLMSLELMLNGAAFAFVLAGAVHGNADGQVMFVLILTLAAAEIAVALALVVHLFHWRRSLDMDALDEVRD